jgi:glycosyltransferase involved in cell wall biosynthesis
VLAEFSPDLVHIFHCQNLSASIIRAALEARVPIVCSLTDFWFVCPIVQLKRPDGSVCRGPDRLASNCLTCYTPRLFAPPVEFEEAVSEKYPGVARLLSALSSATAGAAWRAAYHAYGATKLPGAIEATVRRPKLLRQLLSAAKAIMVPTELMRDIFVENGIPADLISRVPFGLDTEPLLPHVTKSKSDRVRIGFIGTLFEHKGADLLISAFQQLPAQCAAELTLYGDLNQFPEYGQHLLELAGRLSPHSRNITFAGTFPNDKLGDVLSAIDVLVVPSRWYENTPLVVQSAFATRTPVIATNLGGLSELVHHERNGLLFELNDVGSLQAQLHRVIDDRSLLHRLRDGILPERSVADMVDDIELVYDRVAGPSAGRALQTTAAQGKMKHAEN